MRKAFIFRTVAGENMTAKPAFIASHAHDPAVRSIRRVLQLGPRVAPHSTGKDGADDQIGRFDQRDPNDFREQKAALFEYIEIF
ncbi:hypothetical protein J4E08_04215 [Sagittula sp. NFXS13]|uniref:hypothetical protein n=1 Tax=Sagittula sp. NFXS13 TaxID=2819095 RepID=UPI0032DFACED